MVNVKASHPLLYLVCHAVVVAVSVYHTSKTKSEIQGFKN